MFSSSQGSKKGQSTLTENHQTKPLFFPREGEFAVLQFPWMESEHGKEHKTRAMDFGLQGLNWVFGDVAWNKGLKTEWGELYIANRDCISLDWRLLLSFPSAPLFSLIVATTVATNNNELHVQYFPSPKADDPKAGVDLVQYTWEFVLFPRCWETF